MSDNYPDLREIPTRELCYELERREGVTAYWVGLNEKIKIKIGQAIYENEGPAVIYTVED